MTTDAPRKPGDALPAEGLPSTEKPLESSALPETLTRKEAEKLADEKHAKLDKTIAGLEKAASRSTAALEAAEKRATAAEEAQTEADKAKDAATLKAAGDSPDALSIYQAKIAVRDAQADLKTREAKLETDKREHAADIEDAQNYRKVQLANEIALETGVDANLLIAVTDGTEEKMRKAAENLPKTGQHQPAPTIPDSGGGAGGVKKLSEMTEEELKGMSDKDYFTRREAGEKL